jgi:hypothetical protein
MRASPSLPVEQPAAQAGGEQGVGSKSVSMVVVVLDVEVLVVEPPATVTGG